MLTARFGHKNEQSKVPPSKYGLYCVWGNPNNQRNLSTAASDYESPDQGTKLAIIREQLRTSKGKKCLYGWQSRPLSPCWDGLLVTEYGFFEPNVMTLRR